jgi:hypothetical protein
MHVIEEIEPPSSFINSGDGLLGECTGDVSSLLRLPHASLPRLPHATTLMQTTTPYRRYPPRFMHLFPVLSPAI